MLIDRIKQSLGIKNRDLTGKGIHKSQIVRWGVNGFSSSTEILFELLLAELNTMKKNIFIQKFIADYHGEPDEKKIANQIIGIRKWHKYNGLCAPEWSGIDLVGIIMKKMEKKCQKQK